MAKMETDGLSTFASQLDLLAKDISRINRMSLYDGAGAVADEMKSALNAMPVRRDDEYGTESHLLYGATSSEKSQIVSNYGISKFKDSFNSLETSLGFSGYVNTPSKKFNNNVPTGMLMQCIEYGTSFRRGTHTIRRARKTLEKKFLKAFEKKQQEEIEKIMK